MYVHIQHFFSQNLVEKEKKQSLKKYSKIVIYRKNYVLMLSGYKERPVPVTPTLRIDRMAPANDPPLVRRFVNTGDVNRFRFVRIGDLKWNDDKGEYKYIVSDLMKPSFLCAVDDVGGIYVSWTTVDGHLCHDFAIEVAEEKDGIELFRLKSMRTGKYLRVYVPTRAIYSHGDMNEAAKFFLVDEQMYKFFPVQFYRPPYSSMNVNGHVVPYEIKPRDENPLPILIRVPVVDENFSLDFLNFENYGKKPEQGKTYSLVNPAAFFTIVYNPVKKSIALRLTNAQHETRWLCFQPIEDYTAEKKVKYVSPFSGLCLMFTSLM